MEETTDPSSTAAHSAPSEDTEKAAIAPGFLRRLLGARHDSSVDEIDDVASEPVGHGAGTREMLLNVHNMRSLRVRDVAVPRADIVSIPGNLALADVVETFRNSTFTRIPVYTDTLDNPVGFVHLKDVALGFGFNGADDSFDLTTILRPLLYVPPSMPMLVLLQKMQSDRVHMALVIDEYGGVDGLVTIEDLVEQIVGEIADEHDTDEDDQWIAEADGVYLCLARAALPDFEEIAGVDLLPDDEDEDVDTLGGLVFMLAGRVPLRGEIILHPDGHEFEVVDADPRMLKRVRVRLARATLLDQAAE